MFNVISEKYMAVIYQVAAISMMASQLMLMTDFGDAAMPFIVLLMLTAPYAFELWRTRDFMQADLISGLIVVLAFIGSLMIYKSNSDKTMFYLANIVISISGQFIHSLFYSIMFKCSKASSELRRYRVGEDMISFYHFLTTGVLTVVAFNILSMHKVVIWLCIGIYTILFLVKKLTIFIIINVSK